MRSAEAVRLADLAPWSRNPRRISDERMESLKRALADDPDMLWVRPVVALGPRPFPSELPDGTVIMGNQRLRAARELGWESVPTVFVALSDERAQEWALRDNNEYGDWDEDALAQILAEIDRDRLGLTGFGEDELQRLLGDLEGGGDGGAGEHVDPPGLADRFVIPPFSVLDQRAGYWQERKRRWLALGIRSELGRDAAIGGAPLPLNRTDGTTGTPHTIASAFGTGGRGRVRVESDDPMKGGLLLQSSSGADPSFYEQKRDAEKRLGRPLTTAEFLAEHYVSPEGGGSLSTSGTSVFDPVLCEIAFRWFSPPGGRVLDPFAGGSVRGVVAAVLGRRYLGIDLSERQIVANRAQAEEILGIAGDYITDPHEITPVEERGGILVKRDDLFGINGATGGKARATLALAHAEQASALVGVGARTSPQIARVARVAQHLGIPARVHTGVGGDTEETMAAELAGAEIVRHAPARLAVMRKRAADDRSGVLIPWGAEHEITVRLAAEQAANVPEGVARIVVPVGSGTTLAGVLRGVWDRPEVAILGIRMGADPTIVLDRYAPTGWRDRVSMVQSGSDFSERVPGSLGGLPLDPTYEAKCLPWLRGGDLFWIVGGPQAPAPNHPRWLVGDLDTDVTLDGNGEEFYDLVFTCPPYYDLERYSDDPRDLSALSTEDFDAKYARILEKAVAALRADSFAVIVVSDVRGPGGTYRPLADRTTQIMAALGAGLYNRAVLVNTLGSLPVRAARAFTSTRKLGRTHQDVMVYVKGDPRRAAERCGQVDVTLEEVLDATTGDALDNDDAADPAGG